MPTGSGPCPASPVLHYMRTSSVACDSQRGAAGVVFRQFLRRHGQELRAPRLWAVSSPTSWRTSVRCCWRIRRPPAAMTVFDEQWVNILVPWSGGFPNPEECLAACPTGCAASPSSGRYPRSHPQPDRRNLCPPRRSVGQYLTERLAEKGFATVCDLWRNGCTIAIFCGEWL